MSLSWRIPPVSGFDQVGLEQWLERMAAKGRYHAGSLGPLVLFERGEPASVRVRLEPVRNRAEEPDGERKALYEAAGWEYVTCYRERFFVFRTADPQAEEPHTDPVIQSYAIRRFLRRVLLGLLAVLAVSALGYWWCWDRANLDLFLFPYFPLYYFVTRPLLAFALLALALVLWDLAALRGAWLVFRHYHTLKKGRRPDRRRRRRGGKAGAAALLLALLALADFIATEWITCSYTMDQALAETPWVTLDAVEGVRLYEIPSSITQTMNDRVGRVWNLLAPVQFNSSQDKYYERPVGETTYYEGGGSMTVWPSDPETTCRLDVSYYRCLTPGLARALFRELGGWYTFAYGTETERPGFDRLVVYDAPWSDSFPELREGALYALRGNQVLKVEYRGRQSLWDHVDEFAAMLEPGALEIQAKPDLS